MKFKVLYQPDKQIGPRLEALLNEASKGKFQRVTLVSAFAKRAGLRRLSKAMIDAKAKGVELTGIVGIDHGGTTKEGLQDVFAQCDKTYVVHSTRLDVTFHPKAYIFEGTDRAILLLGSSNLTCGGLYTNIEANIEAEFTLPTEKEAYEDATSWLSKLKDETSDNVVLVGTTELAEIEKRLPSETAIPMAGAKGTATIKNAQGAAIFGAGNFPKAPAISSASTSGGSQNATPQTPAPSQSTTTTTQFLPSQGGWKKLSGSDVAPNSSPGSMIIPKALVPLFPPFNPPQSMPSGGTQAEVTFSARYIDGSISKIGDRRLIRYSPAPNHPRPNTESRLAFHDNAINPMGLNKGDILLFEPLVNDPQGAFMNITRVVPTDPRYAKLPGSHKTSAHGLLP